ncbi:MAG TPA: hypothetical protein VK689_15865 [Armatimonadota bacterium]|nr:hypothetical protein [Armatimonadota bacterium]
MEHEIYEAEDFWALWIEITLEFEKAYHEPRNEALIARIYQYAFWSIEHGERAPTAKRDLPTCVCVAFFEHIPTQKASREDMPRWITRDEVAGMRDIFTYLYDGDFEELLQLFGPGQSSQSGRKAKREAKKLPMRHGRAGKHVP